MARALSKRETGFGVVLGVIGVVYLWLQSGSPTPEPAESAAAHAKAVAAASVAPVVRWDLLTTSAVKYDAGGRDLFQYAVRPPSAEELRQRALEAQRQREAAELEARRRQEEALRNAEIARSQREQIILHPPKPQPPPINLKYIGMLGPKNDKVAVFEDGDEQLVHKKGEVIRGQFVVLEIKGETVLMGYTNPAFKGVTRELSFSPSAR